jgi:SAM-dependent methyltransferase
MNDEFLSETYRSDWPRNVSVAIAKAYLKLAPAFPPRYWTSPKFLERAQMEYDDELAGGFLRWFPGVNLAGKCVFDIGSGYGGRPARYRELGARRVVGLEIRSRAVEESRAFAESKGLTNMEFHLGEGEHLPFPDETFDVVTSYDVFEHVHELDKVLDECTRVLRSGGRLLAIFPPFYHPTGSHLEGWISKMPWPNLFFSCDTLIFAVQEIMRERNDGYEPNRMRQRDKLWTVNGATIRSVKALICKREFRDVRIDLAPLFSRMSERWTRWRMRYYAPFFWSLRHMPLLNELFVHRIVLDITK